MKSSYATGKNIDYQALESGTEIQIPLADTNLPDIILETHQAVWSPTPFAIRLAELIAQDDCSEKTVIDLAAGSGILGIVAGLRGAKKVIATDLNPEAIPASERNWELNGLPSERLESIVSDCFEALRENATASQGVDYIYSNPPTVPETGVPKELAGAWNQNGTQGRLVTDAVIRDGRDFLKPGGEILFIATSKQGILLTFKRLREYWGDGTQGDGDDPLDYSINWNERGSAHWAVVDRLDLPLSEYYKDFLPEIRRQAKENGDADPVVEVDGKLCQKLYFIRAINL